MDSKDYNINDRLDYDDAEEEFDDMTWDDLKSDLSNRDMAMYDDGQSYVVVWMFSKSGSRILDPIVGGEQPN